VMMRMKRMKKVKSEESKVKSLSVHTISMSEANSCVRVAAGPPQELEFRVGSALKF
jgi:hypothetical protein